MVNKTDRTDKENVRQSMKGAAVVYLGVNDMSHPLHPFQPLKGLE